MVGELVQRNRIEKPPAEFTVEFREPLHVPRQACLEAQPPSRIVDQVAAQFEVFQVADVSIR
jgi:hypothetical protein